MATRRLAGRESRLGGARYSLRCGALCRRRRIAGEVRDYLWKNAHLVATVVSGKGRGAKFATISATIAGPIANVPSHRALAVISVKD